MKKLILAVILTLGSSSVFAETYCERMNTELQDDWNVCDQEWASEGESFWDVDNIWEEYGGKTITLDE